MQQGLSYTTIVDASDNILSESYETPLTDYSKLLLEFGLKFEKVGYYFQVGKVDHNQGWILDISGITAQFPDLLRTIIPILLDANIAFKIARNAEKARSILDGDFGKELLGKLVCAYPRTDQDALEIAIQLINVTSSFRGPKILTDRHLNGVIFTRYGAVKSIIRINKNGIEEECIYNNKGILVKNPLDIPFILPKEVKWPFDIITSFKAPKTETVLQDKYKPMFVLKEDTKGSVRKGLYLQKIYRIKWCVIKEGRENMCADSEGRNIFDRLRWQFELHKDLEGYISLPKIYDLFQENGDGYLVMEFIKGEALEKVIAATFNNVTWEQLPIITRLRLLDFARQLINLIEKLHRKGYLHRDITPRNFLVSPKDQLCMIDMELAYSETLQKPTPAFRLGTHGFMSPEQEDCLVPTVAQDIYALGGMLVVLLTGLLPGEFAKKRAKVLREQLGFFIPDQDIIQLIGDCLDSDPTLRPPINLLKTSLLQFREKQIAHPNILDIIPTIYAPGKTKLELLISRGIEALASPIMLTQNHLWVSKTVQEDGSANYVEGSFSVYNGLGEGLSGVLYFLSIAHKVGFPIASCAEGYEKSLAHIRNNCRKHLTEMPAGLYFGTTGIATAIIEGIKTGLIPNTPAILEEIKLQLQNGNTDGCGIAKGLAGRGMALLRASSLLDNSFVFPLLQKQISRLLNQQQKDGSWTTTTDKNKRLIKATGFGHGVAGIICFLLEYIKHFKTKDTATVQQAVIKGLQWLIGQKKRKAGDIFWHLNNKTHHSLPGMQEGKAGVMLAFVKAYELFADPLYAQLAHECLRSYPRCPISRDITLATGLVGFGEVCVEAEKIFRSGEWQERADWISQFLLHYFVEQDDGTRYWHPEGTPFQTADFLTGNSGILHFLLRCFHPENLNHSLLPS